MGNGKAARLGQRISEQGRGEAGSLGCTVHAGYKEVAEVAMVRGVREEVEDRARRPLARQWLK